MPRAPLVAALLLAGCGEPWVAGEVIELNDNGAWSWFSDDRLVVHAGKLVVGSVRSVGLYDETKSYADWGNVEISSYDLETGRVTTRVLHRQFEQDDHDSPAFLPLADGRLLAVYARHIYDPYVYIARSAPNDPTRWGEPTWLATPKSKRGRDVATYANLFRLPSGRIVNLYRGFGQDPNLMFSDDEGLTWTWAGRLMHGHNGYSPYLKYAQDRGGAIHFVATEDHPRRFDNSLYHGVLDGEALRRSDGGLVAYVSGDATIDVDTSDFTRVFQGDPDNVAWMTDIEVDADDRPVIAFSVQKDGRDLKVGAGGHDLRYHHATWDGLRWHAEQIAFAGHRLYRGEDDYSGLATLHPRDPRVAFISTNVDPGTGGELRSATDRDRHYELYRGAAPDWDWEPITRDSAQDNLRPLVARWDDERTALVWMRGRYLHNHGEWTTAVLAVILDD